MEKVVKIVNSPFNPSMETAGNIVINLHAPYSENNVTVQINPNFQEYKENLDQPEIEIRQAFIATETDQTKTLNFDFQKNNIQKFEIEKENYEMKLLSIGKENMQGQDFPFFEFLVKWQ